MGQVLASPAGGHLRGPEAPPRPVPGRIGEPQQKLNHAGFSNSNSITFPRTTKHK